MSSVPPPPPGFVLDGEIPPPPPGFILDSGPSKPRKIPVMAGGRPVGMRPATEEEFQEWQATLEEGGKQLLGLTALGAGGAALGALGAVPGVVGTVARAAPHAVDAGVGAYTFLKTGNPLTALGAAAGSNVVVRGALKPFAKYLAKVAGEKDKAEKARAALNAIKEANKTRSSTTAPVGSGASSTPTTPADVLQFRTPASAPASAMRAPAPAQRVAAAPQPGEPSSIEEQLRQSIEAVKSKAIAPKAQAKLTPAQQTFADAQKLEAEIVHMRTENGFSPAQIINVLKERGIRERGAAKAMVDMVMKAYGLEKGKLR